MISNLIKKVLVVNEDQLMDDIREKEFNNEIFATLNEAMDNAVIGIKRLKNNKGYLTSLTKRNHLM